MYLYHLHVKERLNDFICGAFAPTAVLSFNPFDFLQIMPEAHAQASVRLDSPLPGQSVRFDVLQTDLTSASYQGGLRFSSLHRF